MVQEILGRPPSPSEYNACRREVRLLIDRGQLTGWLLPGQRQPLVVRKVDAWIGDHDTATVTEQEQAVGSLAEFTDQA